MYVAEVEGLVLPCFDVPSMNAKLLRHHGWLVVFSLLQLWALRCSALSMRSSEASGRISLVESSLSPHCIGSAALKCFLHLVYEANASSLTLTPTSASCENFGKGQGTLLYCTHVFDTLH